MALRRPRIGCRSRCGPIRSSAARSSTSSVGSPATSTCSSASVRHLGRPVQDLRLRLFLIDIPVIGPLIDALLGVGLIALSMLVSVILLQVLLFRSRWGLRTRSVGEHPKAAETVGIDVIKLRYRNVISWEASSPGWPAPTDDRVRQRLQGEMTAGRGYIALAALIFGRWTPIGAFGAALLFTCSPACSADPDRATRGRAGRVPVHAAFAVL